MIRLSRMLLAVAGVLTALGLAPAQQPAGAVSGQGVVEVKKSADTLRVQVEILVRGKDLKDALGKLRARKEALQKQLAELGAVRESIEFGEPALSASRTERMRQSERMMIERGLIGRPDRPKQAIPVFVAAALKVDWPLKAASLEDLLLVSQTLQDKIKAADLGGLKNPELSPAEEEIAEELRGRDFDRFDRFDRYDRDEEPKRGEPRFVYLSKISATERDQALAEAFRRAKGEAGRLALAAGAELGPLQNLGNPAAGLGIDARMLELSYRGRDREPDSDLVDPNREAAGLQPTRVLFRVAVTASFALKTK